MAITWTLETTPSAGTQGWLDVIWVSKLGLYVAAGGGNPNKVMTSPDSINWTAQPIANVRNIRSLAWNGSVTTPVIVGLSGSASNQCVFTSPDAINWTLQPATPYGAARAMFAVAYGNGIFVAVGNRQIMYSVNDGVTWTASAALPDALAQLSCVTFDGGQFVALANNSVDINIMSSPDGITWTGHHGFEVLYKRAWKSIAVDDSGQFAAVCTGGTLTQQVMTCSGNLDNAWVFETTPQDPNNGLQWNSIRHGLDPLKWIAVGRLVNTPRTTGYLVMTSSGDGTWTPEVSPVDTENVHWEGVCYSADLVQYVTAGFRELDHTTEALGGIASTNNVEIDGSGGVVLNRGTNDNGGTNVSPAGTIVGYGGLVLNRGTDDNGMAVVHAFVASGGLVLNRGTTDTGIGTGPSITGDGGLILNRGTDDNGLETVQCRDDWGPADPGQLPYAPLNVTEAPPATTECSDDWGPSAPGALPYVPLQ